MVADGGEWSFGMLYRLCILRCMGWRKFMILLFGATNKLTAIKMSVNHNHGASTSSATAAIRSSGIQLAPMSCAQSSTLNTTPHIHTGYQRYYDSLR